MYGKNQYGLIQYAHEKSTDEEQKDYYVDLARYAPPFLAEIRELKAIYETEGYAVGLLEHELSELLDQCFISTATWGLTRWEEVYGLVTNMALSYEQRREILMAKLRGQGTTTAQMIKETAETFSGGEIEVIEDNPDYHFIVRFIGIKGIPRNMNAFVSMLEDIKPAHLSYSFEYRYTVWNELINRSWGSVTSYTWDSIRTLKEA
ncbi:YmfQ family protein [Lacrimispora sp.]|uniref:YmfQ family protein n=1 Tax=Lacrimispora sp. TaxID=2719234 RepID=UPI0028615126|nr:YmfQ family protein [Lacrimispora sp.]MDR7813396.1 YmfQ family protein [Lacrimispora sp.]